jgi:hypothetical protein
MRTRRDLLAGLGGAVFLTGCSSTNSQNEPTNSPSGTTTRRSDTETDTPETTTQVMTEDPTETETPGETDTQEPDPEPDPDPRDYSIKGMTNRGIIYEDLDNGILSQGAQDFDFNAINQYLNKQDLNGQIDMIKAICAFGNSQTEARHMTGYLGRAYQQKDFTFGNPQQEPEAITINGNTILGGPPIELETIYTSQGPIYFAPHGDEIDPRFVLGPNQKPESTTQQTIQDALNPEETSYYIPQDYQCIENRAEEHGISEHMGSHNWPEEHQRGIRFIMGHFQNTLIDRRTTKAGHEISEIEIDILPTHSGHEYVGEQKRNGNVGYIAEINKEYNEEFDGGDIDGYMRIHAEDDRLQFDIQEEWDSSMGWAEKP